MASTKKKKKNPMNIAHKQDASSKIIPFPKVHIRPKSKNKCRYEEDKEFRPKVSLEKWSQEHDLDIQTMNCQNCRKEMRTSIPFYTKKYVGLLMPNCECGKNKTVKQSVKILDEMLKKKIKQILS